MDPEQPGRTSAFGGAARDVPAAPTAPVWPIAATTLLAILLVETAVETFWRGSPIRWWVLAVIACWACAMVPASLFLGWGSRLWLTVLATVGVVVFAVWRAGTPADPGLAVLTLTLPRVLAGLSAVAVVFTVVLLVRARTIQRLPWLMGLIVLAGMYCLLPFLFAFLYPQPLADTVRGAGYWTAPPLWLQGAYLALQVLVPLGFVASGLQWLLAAPTRARRPSAVLPAIGCVLTAGVLAATSIDLTRAGIPTVAARLMSSVAPAAIPPAARATTGGPDATGPQVVVGVTEPAGPAAGRIATTKAVELSVERVELVTALGDRAAPPGEMFVVIQTSWRSLVASGPATPGQPGAGAYVVPSLSQRLWLLADGRSAEPIDEAATRTLPGALPAGTLTVPAGSEVLKGSVAFRAAANVSYLALLLLDAAAGDAVVAVKGRPVDAPPAPSLGVAQQNETLSLVATEAGWSERAPPPPPGFRYFTLGLRGTGKAPDDLVAVDLGASGFLQTDQGFVAEPEQATWLRRPFARPAVFLRGYPNEGQLAFLLPAGSEQVRLLLRPRSGGMIDLPVTGQFAPGWPQPTGTITDGTTLRLLRLPPPELPADLPAPPSGRRYLAVDVLVENLRAAQPIEFQVERQLRLIGASGAAYSPVPESSRLPYRPTGSSVVPAAAARRFQTLYLVPATEPLRLEYRGFERTETVEIESAPQR